MADEKTPNRDEDAQHADDASGRWLRDQLKELSESSQAELAAVVPVSAGGSQTDAGNLLESLAINISQAVSGAVLGPMRDLEKCRAEEKTAIENSVTQQGERLEWVAARLEEIESKMSTAGAQSRDVDERFDQAAEEIRRSSEEFSASLLRIRSEIELITERQAQVEATFGKQQHILEALLEIHERRCESDRALVEIFERTKHSFKGDTAKAAAAEDADGALEPPEPEWSTSKEKESLAAHGD
jgi:hypothetical protein